MFDGTIAGEIRQELWEDFIGGQKYQTQASALIEKWHAGEHCCIGRLSILEMLLEIMSLRLLSVPRCSHFPGTGHDPTWK
jgi:hypothetical protein